MRMTLGNWSLSNARNLISFTFSGVFMTSLVSRSILTRAGIGVSNSEVQSVANIIKCAHDKIPFIYLGLPVGKNMRRVDTWNVIVDRLIKNLSSWKAKTLSIGGRLTLVKAVLGNLPIFYLSLFKAPIKIIKRLESLRCQFFLGFQGR